MGDSFANRLLRYMYPVAKGGEKKKREREKEMRTCATQPAGLFLPIPRIVFTRDGKTNFSQSI